MFSELAEHLKPGRRLTPLALAFVALIASAQVNPALIAHPADKPVLPKVDHHACPFEGCHLGTWTVREKVQIYSSWKSNRTVVARLNKREKIRAIEGIHITYEPSLILITAPIAEYGLEGGDYVSGYMSLGEGFFNAWFKGKWLENFDGTGVSRPDGIGCLHHCNARLVKNGRFDWWVQIRTKSGLLGWTNETNKFSGKDSLGS